MHESAIARLPKVELHLHIEGSLEPELMFALAARLCATINSDGPAYFGGYIGQNFRESAEALNLDLDDLEKLARNAVTAAFLSEGGKANLMARIDQWLIRRMAAPNP